MKDLKIYDGKYRISTDAYNWVLYEMIPGKDKDGNPKLKERKSYHPNLGAILEAVSEKELKLCDDLEQIKATQKRLIDLCKTIKGET